MAKNTNFQSLYQTLVNINVPLFLLCLPVYIISVYIGTYRWWLIAPHFRFNELLRSNFIFAYYQVFMPGQLASEGVKGARLTAIGHKPSQIVSSIILDKFIAYSAVLTLGVAALLISQHPGKAFDTMLIVQTAMLTGIVIVVLFSGYGLPKIVKWLTKDHFQFLNEYYEEYLNIISTKKMNLICSFITSLLFQSLCFANNYLIAKSLNINIAYIDWFWITALMAILLVLPISIGGIGVREGGITAMFSFLGLNSAAAVSYALVTYVFSSLIALLGYAIDLFWGIKSKENVEAI